MSEHVFLTHNKIEKPDLYEILDLTATGALEWGRRAGKAIVGSNIEYSTDEATAKRINLLEVQAGFVPDQDHALQYLRLTDAEYDEYYIFNNPMVDYVIKQKGNFSAEEEKNYRKSIISRDVHENKAELLSLAKRILRLGELAADARRGRVPGTMKPCNDCKRETGHFGHFSNAYGLPGTILAGTSQEECVGCGTTVSIPDAV